MGRNEPFRFLKENETGDFLKRVEGWKGSNSKMEAE